MVTLYLNYLKFIGILYVILTWHFSLTTGPKLRPATEGILTNVLETLSPRSQVVQFEGNIRNGKRKKSEMENSKLEPQRNLPAHSLSVRPI